VEKLGELGEKTGWYILRVPAAQAQTLHSADRKSFRVKGHLDQVAVEKLALIPMGEGDYIIPLNASLRKALGARAGHEVVLRLAKDHETLPLHEGLVECLAMEPALAAAFYKLPPSHQRYYSKWIAEAKTGATAAKRIGQCLKAMELNLSFGEAMKL
jgi:hypothetical protein